MKEFKFKEDEFFIFTNPLFYIWLVVNVIYAALDSFSQYTGIKDWYYVLFEFKKLSEEEKETIIYIISKQDKKSYLSYLGRKAGEYLIKKHK